MKWFKSVIMYIQGHLIGEFCLTWCIICLDGIVYRQNPEEHLTRLSAVFDKLRATG